jgi:hypothetical protein
MKLNSLILRLKYDVWQSYTIHVEISDYELYQNIIKSFQEVLLIYWWLTPTIAVFQLYRGVQYVLGSTLFLFRANQSLLFLLNAACLAEKQQIPILKSLVWPTCSRHDIAEKLLNWC